MVCEFTVLSYTLALVYLCVLIALGRKVVVLFAAQQRVAQKTFLVFAVLCCLCRTIYFIMWPLVGTSCRPSVSKSFDWQTDELATAPACFFLSSFSVIAYTFARIWHTCLNNAAMHGLMFRMVVGALVVVNVTIYAVTGVEWAAPQAVGHLLTYSIATACLVVAVGFLTYGLLSYRAMEQALGEDAVDDPTRTTGGHYAKRPEGERGTGFDVDTRSLRSEDLDSLLDGSVGAGDRMRETPRNPMLKIAVVSSVCMVCFLFRVVLLPVMDRYGTHWYMALTYFLLSEVVPLLLMLRVFDTSATSNSDTRNKLLLPGDEPDEEYDEWDDGRSSVASFA